ncbi:MAG: AAA family ATPase [Candidatus Altiarchaeota archaeon]|nr:AAA family ATPase [Candidatus Altiarchaeota archaeon]
MERVKTGIPGLDELIEGGIPEGMVVALVGGAGTGKTIFCSQFVWRGVQNDEKVLYVTFDGNQAVKSIKEQAKQFGMNLDNKKCDVRSFHPHEAKDVIEKIKSVVQHRGYKRIVIDSISMLNAYQMLRDVVDNTQNEGNIEHLRNKMRLNINEIRELGVTTIFTIEDYEGMSSADKIAEFAADGVIKLTTERAMEIRNLYIVKMRETNFELGTHDFKFTKKGIALLSKDSPLKK